MQRSKLELIDKMEKSASNGALDLTYVTQQLEYEKAEILSETSIYLGYYHYNSLILDISESNCLFSLVQFQFLVN
jgi:hypothetical protein